DRVRDLTPRAVSLTSPSPSLAPIDASAMSSADTQAPTRIVSMRSKSDEAAAVDDGDNVENVEHSDAGVLLDAAEHSGVIHGDRRFVTVLVGLLPGWGALVQQIANVPMGAFGVNRVKNLFFRQLQTLAEEKRGQIIRRGPDSFVIAFGTKESTPKDAEHALACAFATQQILDGLAKDPKQRLVAHMGIASGTALATS